MVCDKCKKIFIEEIDRILKLKRENIQKDKDTEENIEKWDEAYWKGQLILLADIENLLDERLGVEK